VAIAILPTEDRYPTKSAKMIQAGLPEGHDNGKPRRDKRFRRGFLFTQEWPVRQMCEPVRQMCEYVRQRELADMPVNTPPGTIDVVMGDARLRLEEAPAAAYDVLIIDAFSSDAIPVHLLTEEAFHLYLAHLRGPDSVLAFNVTNKSVDLRPVLLSHAMHNHMNLIRLCRPQGPRVDDTSDWILLSRNHKMLELLSFQGHVAPMPPFKDALRWTDDYSNLFQVLRKR